MFFYSKEMIVSLDGLYNVSYIIIFIFFKIMVLPNAILDFFFEVFASSFIIRNIAFCRFVKLLRLFRNFAGLRIINYYY